MGPVAGTGANITAMSYDGAFDMGIFVDPEAITDPASFAGHVQDAFADLIAAGIAATKTTVPKKRAATKKKAATKKRAATKSPARKQTARKQTVGTK